MSAFKYRQRARAYQQFAKTLRKQAAESPDRLKVPLMGAAYSLDDAVTVLDDLATQEEGKRDATK